MPLRAIKQVIDEDPARTRALVELEDRILERAAAGDETRISAAELRRSYDIPKEVLDRCELIEDLGKTTQLIDELWTEVKAQ